VVCAVFVKVKLAGQTSSKEARSFFFFLLFIFILQDRETSRIGSIPLLLYS